MPAKKPKPNDYWRKKLANDQTKDGKLPRVVKNKGQWAKRLGPGTTCIPAPRDVDKIMKRVPDGKVTTINEIRTKVARDHKAMMGCPMTTGIFAWIAAEAAAEEMREGRKKITPYWRTLKGDGEINPKYPGGVTGQKRLLRQEGHKFTKKGKRVTVSDWQKKLYRPK